MMVIYVELVQWHIHFFDRKASSIGIKTKNMLNKELVEELHKAIIRKFGKIKINLPFIDNNLLCWSCWYAINRQI